MYNFHCRTRIAGGFMIRDYVANQSKDNNKKDRVAALSYFCVAMIDYRQFFPLPKFIITQGNKIKKPSKRTASFIIYEDQGVR